MTDGNAAPRTPSMTGPSLLARTAMVTATVIAVLAVAVGLWYARTAMLLAFAGVLLAIVLYSASLALAEITRLPRLIMLAIVVVAVAAFFVLVL